MDENWLQMVASFYKNMLIISNRISPRICMVCVKESHIVFVDRDALRSNPFSFDTCLICYRKHVHLTS